MQKKRSLAIISKALAPYRVRFYSEVAKAMKAKGWTVTLIVAMVGAKDHPWTDPGTNSGEIELVGLGSPEESLLRRGINGVTRLVGIHDVEVPNIQLIRELNRINPDVVWTHEYSPFCLAAALWASIRDRHCVVSSDLGANPPPHSCSPLQLSVQKAMSFLYEGVIAQTMEATRRTHPKGAPINFAPHAIDTDEYFPAEIHIPHKFRFLFAAGIRQEKGIMEVVRAGEVLAAEGLCFEVRVVGSGPLDSWLAEQTHPWLSVAGFQEGENLRKEYREADAYVLPTAGDTYGVTVHEAAASGLPLIVGRTAGAVETLVHEGVTGFAVDAKDVGQLAAIMKRLLLDPDRARDMGRAARAASEIHDVKALGKRTADFITTIAGETKMSELP